jgi:hypothetical protein
MGHSNFPTERIDSVHSGYVCAYCLNTNLVIDDDFDEHGGYRGTVYYCTCEKAKLEQQMLREIDTLKSKEAEIRAKYATDLNKDAANGLKFKLKDELFNTLRTYMYYGLNHLTNKEAIELFEGALIEYRYEFDDENN